jgi:predicted transcriptional regulator
MRRRNDDGNGEVADLLRDLLITSLGTAGVKQTQIRKIAGCGMNRVNEIVKHIEQERKRGKERG